MIENFDLPFAEALKFDEALQYIDMWQPDTNMKLMIEYANAQMYITQ